MSINPETRGINTFSEKSLHIALKAWYARPGDRLEVEVDGCVIDLVRDNQLIEIQTRNFSTLKSKLNKLLDNHPVRVVHPVAEERWLVKVDAHLREISRRRSPKRGSVFSIFDELLYVPQLVKHPNFSVELLLVRDAEIRLQDGRGSWRRKGWSIYDRQLIEVVDSVVFTTSADFLNLLPAALPQSFTTADLAAGLRQSRAVAQKMAYCLKAMEVIQVVDKRGNALVYNVVS